MISFASIQHHAKALWPAKDEFLAWPRWRKAAFVAIVFLTLSFVVHEFLTPYRWSWAHLGRLVLKTSFIAGLYFLCIRWIPNPLTAKKLEQFHQIKRGYYSFVILAGLLLMTMFGPMIISNRALVVGYEGKIYFPTYTAFHPGTDFGFDYQYETNYRDLKERFQEEGGGFVLLPLVPYSAMENDYGGGIRHPAPPSFERRHFLGTDKTGRDVLARLFYGFQIAMLFTLGFLLLVYVIGIAVGCAMGYFGGVVDLLGQRLVEIWANIPFLYMVIISVSLVPAGVSIPSRIGVLMLVMVLFSWTTMTFYMRTATYREKSRDYVAAARILGASTPRIIFGQVVPNTIATIVTFVPFNLASAIITITALDYLNFGLPPPTPSWGAMLSEGKSNMQAPWILLSPFFAMIGTLTLVTFVGEAIRDAFDPKKFTIYR